MAVGPQMAIDAFKEEVTKFEEHFDTQIISKKVEPGGTIFISMPDGCYQKHFEELRTRYIDAGWADVTLSEGGYGSNGGLTFHTKK